MCNYSFLLPSLNVLQDAIPSICSKRYVFVQNIVVVLTFRDSDMQLWEWFLKEKKYSLSLL